MQNFARRLMSGASLALLAFGGQAARASSGPRTQLSHASQQLSQALASAAAQGSADVIAVSSAVANYAEALQDDRSAAESAIVVDELAIQNHYTSKIAPKLTAAYDALTDQDNLHRSPLFFAKTNISHTLNSAFANKPPFRTGNTTTNTALGISAQTRNVGFEQFSAHNQLINFGHAYEARASASGVAKASATGIGVLQSGGAVLGASNAVVNRSSGAIAGLADALATSSHGLAHARAAGISQVAVALAAGAKNIVTNTSKAFIGASAVALAGGKATADAVGVAQFALGKTATDSVNNAGIIEAYALAGAFDTSAHARAEGVDQDPIAHTVHNSVENQGVIFASAIAASISGVLPKGTATARGVHQTGHGTEVGNLVDNDRTKNATGEIAAFARLIGVDNGHAHAVAVSQVANATHAHNTVFNSGEIFAGAVATVTGATGAVYARATGIGQVANGTHPHNYVNNEPDGAIVAGAAASSAHTASAKAYGIYQSAVGGHTGDTEQNTVKNFDLIEAGAVAYNGDFLTAKAVAVFQTAEGEGKAVNDLTNKADILAAATAHNGFDRGNILAVGVLQVGTGNTVNNYVDNQGFIGATAHMNNVSVGNYGSTRAEAVGVGQSAGTFAAFAATGHNRLINSAHDDIIAVASASNVHPRSGVSHAGIDVSAIAAFQVARGDPAYNSMTNHGLMGASAYVYDAGTIGLAGAIGALQEASAAGGKASNVVHNYQGGSIVAFAHASDATHAAASAHGAFQFVAVASTAKNFVSNSGLIGARGDAVGYYTGTHVAQSAYAHVGGIKQFAIGGYQGYNSVYNRGTVVALASASKAHYVSATARGISQTAFLNGGAGNYTQNDVRNTGVVLASARAHLAYSHSGAGHAYASAIGVDQYVQGHNVYNTVLNKGVIFAKAQASTANDMRAYAAGVYEQGGYVNGTATAASNYLTNPGAIGASARVSGVAGSGHFADTGRAKAFGVYQLATASSDINKVYNTGTVFAHASVTHVNNADATAIGVNQVADATQAHNFVSNGGGAILAEASVHAYGNIIVSVDPFAQAVGVKQFASATGSATNVEKNDKALIAQARETGGFDAFADATGVYQVAIAGDTAKNFVSNKGLIAAIASVSTGHSAGAEAYGAFQYADPATYAYNTVDNYATGVIFAQANVFKATDGDAYAMGAYQYAHATTLAKNVVANTGVMIASARDHNSTSLGFFHAYSASARAFGAGQVARADYTAANTVDNKGHMVGYATASDAYIAFANGYGAYQSAVGGASAKNYVSNTHSGIIAAIALAHGRAPFSSEEDRTVDSGLNASAYAIGVGQYAHATHSGANATNSVVNHGAIGAYASANSAYFAHGYAQGVDQYAAAHAAKNYVSNDGLIAGMAFAHSAAYAFATGVGVQQLVSAHSAHQTVSNKTGGFIVGYASVNGSEGLAFARGKGIGQSGYATDMYNAVTNHGAVLGVAHAYGEDSALASAVGVGQSGYENAANAVAENKVHNYGFIGASAYANVNEFTAEAYAQGVAQFAYAHTLATNHVYNAGTIAAVAGAYGSGFSGDNAYAYAHGISQEAIGYHGGTTPAAAGNFVVNSSHGHILAAAHAGSVLDNAYATATGIAQRAINTAKAGGRAENRVTNNGFVGAFATASASFGTAMVANAAGVSQYAHAGSDADNHVSNDGHGAIVAIARAHGRFTRSTSGSITSTEPGGTAIAKAYGIDQHAYGFDAANSVQNRGEIIAIASAGFASSVHATAKGINQHAHGSTGDGDNFVNNYNGVVGAEAFALGPIFTSGSEVGARAYGIDQHATAAGYSAANAVYNHKGEIFAIADAYGATAASVAAEAKGINQVADPNYLAANYVDSLSALNFASAYAVGRTTSSAAHTAKASAWGVDQRANAGYHAYNTVDQVGYHTGAGTKEKHFGVVVASAFASDDNVVNATAKAVNQTANASYADNNVVNDGGLIAANAKAANAYTQRTTFVTVTHPGTTFSTVTHHYSHVNGGTAQAKAYGVNQHATGEYGYNDVVNFGTIFAHASASGGAYAHAHLVKATAKGVNQEAYGAGYETNDVVNVGRITAVATAHGAKNYTSVAKTTKHGVFSFPGFSSPGFTITTTFGGHITFPGLSSPGFTVPITNHTSHKYTHGGIASARAFGVDQHADALVAVNEVVNFGQIFAYASASSANVVVAQAKGVNQVATASGSNNHAGNGVLNFGTIFADARAHHGVSAYTTSSGNVYDTVSAKAWGVEQRANGVYAHNGVTNFGGDDNSGGIFGVATASNLNHYEFAHAHGISQVAHGVDVTNDVVNLGVIVGYAHAYSSAGDFAAGSGTTHAYAHAVGRGIEQHATGSHAKNTVINEHGYVQGSGFASSAYRAVATGTGIYQYEHQAGSGEHANENLAINSGHVVGNADAHLAVSAEAFGEGVRQSGYAQTPLNVAVNGSHALIGGFAVASAKFAEAGADGVGQYAGGPFGHESATNIADNIGGTYTDFATSSTFVAHYAHNGVIEASAQAFGHTIGGVPGADAFADAYGIAQRAVAYTHAHNMVENGGIVRASAEASFAHNVDAFAVGVEQEASANNGSSAAHVAENFVGNNGVIEAFANADHNCATNCSGFTSGTEHLPKRDFDTGNAVAEATGVGQGAFGDHAYNTVSNFRTTSGSGGFIFASAKAKFAHDAEAYADGVRQFASGHFAKNAATNSGTIEAHAEASGGTFAGAGARGVDQTAAYNSGVQLHNYVSNAGFIGAFATAIAGGDADASAYATGVRQAAFGVRASDTVSNTRHAAISAIAFAEGVPSEDSTVNQFADAYARGVNMYAHAHTLVAHVANSGLIRAVASADVTYGTDLPNVIAQATGIRVQNYSSAHGVVEGTINNFVHGRIHADAYASRGTGIASAVGVNVIAREFVGEVYNAGTIDAQAFASSAHATAIRVGNNGHNQISSGHLGNIVNDGGFLFASTGKFVFRTTFGSATSVFDRGIGNAINVESAPNEVDITLRGSIRTGEVFGNIEDATSNPWSNKISVRDGITFMDGSINPELGGSVVNPTAPTTGTLGTGGSLTITPTGTLWLPAAGTPFIPGLTSFWGQNPVLDVNSYTQRGALWIALSGPNAATINANTVDLSNGSGGPGGTVGVILNPYVLPTTTTYTVITAFVTNDLGNGTNQWSSVSLLNFPSSPLLSVAASYPGGTAADITLTRLAFDMVPGLTHNQEEVGDGLEGGYAGCVSAQCQAFYQAIFQLTATEYGPALNMLSGAQAGEVEQSNVGSVNRFVDTIVDRMNSMDSILGVGGLAAPHGDGITVWGSPYGSWTNTGSTLSGPGYNSSHAGIVLGADLVLPDDPNILLGVAGNLENKSRFQFNDGTRWASLTPGGFGSSSGWDIAVYGRYNNATDWSMPFYIKGSASYGTYDNETVRPVVLPLLPAQPGAPTVPSPGRFNLVNPNAPVTPVLTGSLMSAKFNSTAWSVYGEGGVKVDTGDPDLNLTPFLGLRYIDSISGRYMETSSNAKPGIAAAALNVNDASATALVTYLGAELSTTWNMGNNQAILPSLRLAWTHNFDDPWRVSANFEGVGPASNFAVDASSWSHDSGLVDASFSMLFDDNLMGSIGYTANINSTQFEQSVYGRLDIKF